MRRSVVDTSSSSRGQLTAFHSALIIQFVAELISGLILSLFYRPSKAYETDQHVHQGFLGFVQACHYWQSSLLIIESLVLVAFYAWNGSTLRERKVEFLSCLLIFLASMGFQMSGNALPFDRHGVQTAVIEASIAARVPTLGSGISQALLGGSEFSSQSLPIWYGLHLSLTVLALGALAIAFSKRSGIRAELGLRLSLSSLLPSIVLAIFIHSPLGHKATTDDFNSFSDKASWYTWPLHGALTMASRVNPSAGWIGAMLIPALFLGGLILLLVFKPSAAGIMGKVLCVTGATFFGVASILYGGSIDPLTGTRDPSDGPSSRGPEVLSKPIDEKMAQKGRALINSAGCAACHGVDGLQGKGGPSLKSVQDRHSDPAYFERYVKNPQSIDSNSTMPAFPQLSSEQLREIAEYLRSSHKPGK